MHALGSTLFKAVLIGFNIAVQAAFSTLFRVSQSSEPVSLVGASMVNSMKVSFDGSDLPTRLRVGFLW